MIDIPTSGNHLVLDAGFGARLKQARINAGIRHASAASKIIGRSASSVSSWENGKVNKQSQYVLESYMIRDLKVDPNYIFTGEGNVSESAVSETIAGTPNTGSIGCRLKKFREAAGLSVQQVADSMGQVYKTIIKWEKGRNVPYMSKIEKLADLYNVEISEIVSNGIGIREMANKSSLAARISEFRKSRTMSRTQLAARVGCTTESIKNWESGAYMPSSKLLRKLADIFGVTELYLLGKCGNGGLADGKVPEFAEPAVKPKQHVLDFEQRESQPEETALILSKSGNGVANANEKLDSAWTAICAVPDINYNAVRQQLNAVKSLITEDK